ncbi:hypothetical protein [Methanosarcina sp. MSH10X1]|uniref:hypothetical protein n=1 Tax=Methanosarcina sp. MSH10X1 TaxID=2507075 RepID=UPI00197BB162|nr:hypothetical protein [Methanosarcina sp. MSH10X1]
MNANSDNPIVGRMFQELSTVLLSEYYNKPFSADIAILIGEPAKQHKFDCVSEDKQYVAECKCYRWTEAGNIPSAKVAAINEAVLYMLFLPAETVKIIIMEKATHVKKNETLAEYYVRTYRHLLKGIKVLEIDTNNKTIRAIKD